MAWVLVVFGQAARGPLLHEDCVHLITAQGWSGLGEALDPNRIPLRPFQHLAFYLWAQTEPIDPLAMRLPALIFHLLSCGLVYRLAREMGAGAPYGAVALLLFAVFPNGSNLVMPAAIGSPGYVTLSLAALVLFVRGNRVGSDLALAGGLVCTVLALGFHQAAVLVPAVLGIWILATSASRSELRRRLLRPVTGATFSLMAGYVLYFQFFRPQAVHRGVSFDALPATTAKAITAFLPEFLRTAILDGLRGHTGVAGSLFGFGACALLLAAFAYLVYRGSSRTRFAAWAVALLLALPACTTGFVLRYAYFASAILACGLAFALERASGEHLRRVGVVTLLVLGLSWSVDSIHDAREYANAGELAERLLDQATEERERLGPRTPIAVVDLPDQLGSERDISFFALGFRQALWLRDVHGPWHLWRTAPGIRTTDQELRTEQEISAAARSGKTAVLRYEPQRRELTRVEG